MNILPKKIITQKTARVFTSGNHENPEYIWVICHGYGQLANFFLRKFSSLDDGKNLLICPEALHRFYTEGFSGRVGASWMTKEDREDDISDYINWLEKVYEEFIPKSSDAKIILAGFSQGGATVCRWLAHSKNKVEHLVLYASTFPPDVELRSDFAHRINGKIFFVVGNKDEFMDAKEKQKQLELLSLTKKKIEMIEYEGNHDINEGALKKIKNLF